MAPKPAPLLQGTLDLIVLQLLRAEPTNGYELAQRIQTISRDVLTINAGSLYPALYRLERQGFIRSEWGVTANNRRARYYALTPQGRRHLNQELAGWRRVSRAINLVLEATLDSGGA